jgi:type II secretory pathway pseudopilin PulG
MRCLRKKENGFTITELAIMILIISALVILSIPRISIDRNSARHAELKICLHTIQVAIERYFEDHKEYPCFLLGGDREGWDNWHELNDEIYSHPEQPSNNLVCDILIEYGYLQSYPRNPFVDDGMKIITSTTAFGSGPNGQILYGDGDPRFGFTGRLMGNGLDDPAYYQHRIAGIPPKETPLLETRRTLNPFSAQKLGFKDPPEGLHYMMGGRKLILPEDPSKVYTVATWWPGNFFYRSFTETPLERRGWSWFDPGVPKVLRKGKYYILGGYGATTIEGLDVIRLEGKNYDASDDIYYRLPPPWYRNARANGIKCGYSLEYDGGVGTGLPEVAGGGDPWTGPFYPYDYGDTVNGYTFGEIIYGAPDGHPDGVIQVLTDDPSTTMTFNFHN